MTDMEATVGRPVIRQNLVYNRLLLLVAGLGGLLYGVDVGIISGAQPCHGRGSGFEPRHSRHCFPRIHRPFWEGLPYWGGILERFVTNSRFKRRGFRFLWYETVNPFVAKRRSKGECLDEEALF